MALVISEVRYREPLAVMLLRAVCQGRTIEELVAETGLPEERIRMRIEAARRYLSGC